MCKHLKILVFVTLLLGFVGGAAIFNPLQTVASSQFNAGRIIDDSIFYNPHSMSAQDIQNFLNAKVPYCDTWGNQPISSGSSQTRAQWAAANGKPAPPYTCLKDYQQNIPSRAPDQYCSGSVSSGTKSAATIIKEVANACSVNPQVLLVLLQKEQSFITDNWPWPVQYEKATGYDCPDTAPCNPEYAGFFNQVYYGARQYQRYAKQAHSFGYQAGRTNYIQYNPNPGCGGSNVYIQNQATAGLYIYTPYQPNPATLAAAPGQEVHCGAYGNINFWRTFSNWFGATTSDSDTHFLSFVRLNHSSGKAEEVGYSSIGSYEFMSRYNLSSYPAISPDGSVIPRYKSNGDLSFIRLNHSSGKVEIVTYSAASGYKQLVDYQLSAYPAVAPDGAVIPLYKSNDSLSFIRLNHSSGKVEIVTYSAASGYKQLVDYQLSAYPAVAPDGAVIPLYKSNDSLSFIRLNHSSGKVEIVTYSAASGYKQLVDYQLSAYPAVAPDGAVIPIHNKFKKDDLSFIRLNHSSGRVEVVTYTFASGFKNISEYKLTGYPAVAPDGAVIPLLSRR